MSRTVATLLTVANVVVMACSDAGAPLWEDGGEHREMIDVLMMPDTIAVNDTLVIGARGLGAHGRPAACRWESVRSQSQLALTLWVRSDRWVGSYPPPPYDLAFECQFEAAPPFPVGTVHIVGHQPDGGSLIDSVAVIP